MLKLTLATVLLASAQAGKCPFGYTSSDSKRNLKSKAIYPHEVLTCSSKAVLNTDKDKFNSIEHYKEVVEAVIEQFDTNTKEG